MKKIIEYIFVGLTLSILFSAQFPLPMVNSNYASINLSDFVIVIIGFLFLFQGLITTDWKLSLVLPNLTVWFLFVGAWIIVSLTVAAFRSPISILPNVLWTLKWFEIIVVFILAQHFADQISWRKIISIIVWASLPIAIIAILRTVTTTGWTQPTVFWRNPSTLAVFLGLPGLLSLFSGFFRITEENILGVIYLLVSIIFFSAIITTGSRAGLLTIVVGIVIAGILASEWLSISLLAISGTIGASIGFGLLWITGRSNLLTRYFPTIAFEHGGLVISGTGSTGINKRIELLQKGINLWTHQPIFGYGWFSSPENPLIGFLDDFYIQILVDLGIVGFIITIVLYLEVTRSFIRRRYSSTPTIVFGGAGWVVGLLAAGLGGAHPRTPRLMFLLVLILTSATQLKRNEKVLPPSNR